MADTTDSNLSNWLGAIQNQYNFGTQAYLDAAPSLMTANDAATGIAKLQANTALDQAALSSNLTDRMGTFNDMQDAYAKDAFGYNSAERQQRVSDKAMADVEKQFGDVQGQSNRDLSRRGVNPSSGRSLALSNQLGISKAAAMAGAANKARQDLETTANDRQKTAINFGANLPGQATSAAQTAAYVGNAASSNASAPVKNLLDFAGGLSNVYGNAASGYKGLYTTLNLSAADQARIAAADAANQQAQDSAYLQAIGGFLGSKTGDKVVDKVLSWTGL